MLFAEITAEGWAIIVGAIALGAGGIITPIVTAVIAFKREQRAIERQAKVAEKVAEVAVTAATSAKQLTTIEHKVDAVHEVANSLSEARAHEAGEAGFARGVKSETDKH